MSGEDTNFAWKSQNSSKYKVQSSKQTSGDLFLPENNVSVQAKFYKNCHFISLDFYLNLGQ
jgi:hypothetical protein